MRRKTRGEEMTMRGKKTTNDDLLKINVEESINGEGSRADLERGRGSEGEKWMMGLSRECNKVERRRNVKSRLPVLLC